jgi:hypothetical protein
MGLASIARPRASSPFSPSLFTITNKHAPMHAPTPTTLIAVGLIQAWILVIFIGCPILLGYLIITGKQGQLNRMLNDPSQTHAQKELARRQLSPATTQLLFQLKSAD